MAVLSKKKLTTDILVAGGGTAGVPAAIAAARNGAKVILVQNRSVLGGNASSEIRMHILGADCGRNEAFSMELREGGIMEEVRLDLATQNPQRSASMLDLILYDKCISEPNLTLMLNSYVDGVTMKDSRIVSAHVSRPSTEEEFEIEATYFIDCTGDGRLGAEAGAKFNLGRESGSEFNEKRAVLNRDSKRLGSSLLFTSNDTGKPMPYKAPSWARKFTKEDLRLRLHKNSGFEYGYWWIEFGGVMDTIRDNEFIRDELLKTLFGVWDYIKNSGEYPGAANWALNWFGFHPGKRESRRFIGKYILRESDLEEATHFEDTIAYGGWPMDTHPPEGINAKDEEACLQPLSKYAYEIPLRSCVSENIDNLLFAGRNMSCTHIAFSSTRVMATCAVIGEGTGTFAATAVNKKVDPKTAWNDKAVIKATQEQLLKQDAFLPGYKISGPELVKGAVLSASSEQPEGKVENLIDGETRSVHGPHGVRPDLTVPGTHRWMSKPGDPKPWVQLEWKTPVDFKTLTLVLDTGLHRRLTLTQENNTHKTQIWSAQPETLKDFDIFADTGKGFEKIKSVRDNYYRLIPIELGLKGIKKLKVECLSTNGLDHSRIYEVRVAD